MSYTFDQTILGSVHGISLAASGCGPCSVASIVYNLDNTITPVKVANKLYDMGAFFTSGTTRAGITKIVQHYGFAQPDYYTPEHRGGDAWNKAVEQIMALKKANKEFYLIFLAVGTSDGAESDFWTYGGHYLSGTDIKVDNNEVYVRDSGSRGHTGWYPFRKLQYCVNVLWVIQPKEQIKKAYAGDLPVPGIYMNMSKEAVKKYKAKCGTTMALQVKRLQLFLNWYYDDRHLRVTREYDYNTIAYLLRFQHLEGLTLTGKLDTETLNKMKEIKK